MRRGLTMGALAICLAAGLIGTAPCGAQDIDMNGFILNWLILGPFRQPGGANPPVDAIQEDYLYGYTEFGDEVFEEFILPVEDMEIDTDYAVAASQGLASFGPGINEPGIPTWFNWTDFDDTIVFDKVFRAANDDAMAYACTYVVNLTDELMPVVLAVGSDDSIEVFIQDESVLTVSASRPSGGAGAIQDRVATVLYPGINRVLVKVFEGGGGWEFRLRFEQPDGTPIVEGDIEIALEPDDLELPIPYKARRTLSARTFEPGDTVDVTIEITELPDPAPASVRITETLPAGWDAEAISDGGQLAGGTITWDLAGGDVAVGKTLTYRATAPDTLDDAFFQGLLTVADTDYGVTGDAGLLRVRAIDDQGFIRKWLILAPLARDVPGANPSITTLEEDYITGTLVDGTEVDELSIWPCEGMEVDIDYDVAASSGLITGGGMYDDLNPGGIPQWFAWTDPDDTIALDNVHGNTAFGPPVLRPTPANFPENFMAYGCTYVVNHSGDSIFATVAIGSDDSIHVYVNDESALTVSAARPWGNPGEIQDRSIEQVELLPGENRVLVKIFDGEIDCGWRLRFEDELGMPITPDTYEIEITLRPEACGGGPPPPPEGVFHRGDADANGSLTIGDSVFILNYLFAGGAAPVCMDSIDIDDNGSLTIGDPIALLNYSFAGGPPPAAPGPPPNACGPDPTTNDPWDDCPFPDTACP